MADRSDSGEGHSWMGSSTCGRTPAFDSSGGRPVSDQGGVPEHRNWNRSRLPPLPYAGPAHAAGCLDSHDGWPSRTPGLTEGGFLTLGSSPRWPGGTSFAPPDRPSYLNDGTSLNMTRCFESALGMKLQGTSPMTTAAATISESSARQAALTFTQRRTATPFLRTSRRIDSR